MNDKEMTQTEIKFIGVDIGGSKISAGLVGDGKMFHSIKVPTPAHGGVKDIIEVIVHAIKDVSNEKVEGIGIGIPGYVDTKSGIVSNVHNIPSFKNVPLKEILENRIGKTVMINNDANCFTLGTKKFGEGRHFHSLVGVTLGTGLGSGIIINNKLYEGVNNGAGEFGLIPYKESVLEDYCSGKFFKKQYGISGKAAQKLAKKGDQSALDMYKVFGHHLGEAIKMILYTLSPEAVMLGGSISRNFELFQKSMWNSVKSFPYKNVIDNFSIIPVLNPEIAIIGAAYLNEKLNKFERN